ncbi:MAG: DNA mismatch repair protein MutS [Planctomycetota bacterium]|nr:DNA mismatch repair protein MutS [Planctomycetota bacterium]MDA1214330.1 DNA mismatch repair protein MutS [Planctomycetota bacterium]
MPETAAKLTPMMERYLEVKGQNPGTLLLFRMGDFYELFYEDAQIASRILGLTLTSRDKNSPSPVPMAGFPYHALDQYLQKLIQSGQRVAICEQVEDPKEAKGLVRREVTRVVTAGTLTDENLLDPRQNNFLACVCPTPNCIGLAWLDLSTGRFLTCDLKLDELADELSRIRPVEVLVPESYHPKELQPNSLAGSTWLCTERPLWCFSKEHCQSRLMQHFGTSTLTGFDLTPESPGITAAGVLLEYLKETQKGSLGHINRIETYHRADTLKMDDATRRSLEIVHTLREGSRDGSLLSILDETVTPMGARLLAEWLANPLTNIDKISQRLNAVDEFMQDPNLCRELKETLSHTYDLQRLTARIATGRAHPRDLASLAKSLALLPRLKAKISGRQTERINHLERQLDLCAEVRADIETVIVEDPPLQVSDGGVIREGFHAELDELRGLARGGKEWIARYQAEESARTGIPNLKVGFNRVFGYYLEVTASQASKIPPDYIRKQTLKNQERFITPALKEYEEKVLRAEERGLRWEQELFQALRERVAQHAARIQQSAEVLAEIDVLVSFSILALRQRYCRPELVEEPILDVVQCRHPVLDRLQPSGRFVPNDIRLGNKSGTIQIITGPNMAGKSTYIRQAALITLMAQIGSFVPATSARIGVADRIFARVGASDELSKGQSTFMVEMTETARILNSATDKSLVILDEIGRGTSTYDGISIAWAVTEYLHDVVGSRTLFATHYHELTTLTSSLPRARNWNVAVHEQDEQIVFLHQIVEGAADKSYGIHVARLAGIPADVIERARIVLNTLESDHVDETGRTHIPGRASSFKKQRQLSLFAADQHPLLDEIRELDLEHLSPSLALETLQRFRQRLTAK